MRVLLLDNGSNFLDFGMRCLAAGHDVLWYDSPRKDGSVRMAGKGIVPRLIDYDKLRSRYMDWADIVVMADNTKYMDLMDEYRDKGYPIFGPSSAAAEWELDRSKGQEIMRAAGLNIIPGVEFHDYDEAAAFVQENPQYLVSKPSGDADKALSYVAPDAASLLYMFERWSKNEKYAADAKKHGFILQEKKSGAEFACGGWFGPGGWSKWWYENLEFKKMMNGDLGPNTGEAGTLSMYVRKSKLAEVGLKPVTKYLRAIDYVGFIDISGMVDEDGEFWPFEWTMRPGWPTFHNQNATHEGDPVEWMLDLIHGKDTLQVKENIACVTVVIAIPDYPVSRFTNKEVSDIPVYLHDADKRSVHLSEIKLGEAFVDVAGKPVKMPCLVTSGDYVAVVSGTGETITGARRSVYATVKKIKMPANPFYRTDIGRYGVDERLRILQKVGYALNFKIT